MHTSHKSKDLNPISIISKEGDGFAVGEGWDDISDEGYGLGAIREGWDG